MFYEVFKKVIDNEVLLKYSVNFIQSLVDNLVTFVSVQYSAQKPNIQEGFSNNHFNKIHVFSVAQIMLHALLNTPHKITKFQFNSFKRFQGC